MFLQDHKKTAIIWKDQQISYSELIENVGSYASIIKKDNLSKVAVFSENRPEWIYAFYSGWKKNACVVPIDFMSSSEDVAYILNDCKPEVVFYSNQTKEVILKANEELAYEPSLMNIDEITY